MNPKSLLMILTYADVSRPEGVASRLRASLRYMDMSKDEDPIAIVDDGSTAPEQHTCLDELEATGRYRVVRRAQNGGIARAKNTCLRVFLESDAEVGFLAEDDIIYWRGWREAYLEAVVKTGIQHFSWYMYDPRDWFVQVNGFTVRAHHDLLGQFLVFTRKAVETVGGFPILPHRYGFEHVAWSRRIHATGLIPFHADIPGSGRYISSLPGASRSLPEDEIELGLRMNSCGLNFRSIREDIIE